MEYNYNCDVTALIADIRKEVEVRASALTDADGGAYQRMNITERTLPLIVQYISEAFGKAVAMCSKRYNVSLDADNPDTSIGVTLDIAKNHNDETLKVAFKNLRDYAMYTAIARWYANTSTASADVELLNSKAAESYAAFARLLARRTPPTRTVPKTLEREATNFE